MEHLSVLLVMGSAVIISFLGGKTVQRFRLPMVIGYVLTGVILGKSLFNVLSPDTVQRMHLVNDLALGIIAFLIGEELNFRRLKRLGRVIFTIAIFESMGAFLLVTLFTYWFSHKIYLALILGAVASATAPAATVAVINQYRARGTLTTTILGVVGSDDAIALIIYAFASAVAYPFIVGHSVSFVSAVIYPLRDVFLSILIGSLMGLVLSYLFNKLHTREEIFALTVGALLIGEGLAAQLGLSELLLIMSMAIVGNNFSRHFVTAGEFFNVVGFPIVAAFFCLAGTRLDITLLPQIGLLGLVYLFARMSGKYFGAMVGAKLSSAPDVVQRYVGFSLWPQIGVAVALAITVERNFAHLGAVGHSLAAVTMNVLLFTTIFTEVIGPLSTKISLAKAGEINKK